MQLKGGRSRFGEETESGWKFRPKKKHIPYWLDHSLPMYVLLIDKDAQKIYWQELSERTLKTGPRGGIYVHVPKDQTLASAGPVWEIAAEKFADTALADYSDNLSRLAPSVVRALKSLSAANADAAALLAAHLARGRGAPEVVVRTLTESDPAWLSPAGAGVGLFALADYAHAHGLEGLAADLLLTAAERTPESKYRYTLTAGLIVLDSDRPRARDLITLAASMPESSDEARVKIGRALLAHPEGSAAPVALSGELTLQLEAIADDDLVLSFLGHRSEATGDFDRAVSLFEQALALVPDSAVLMNTLARVLTRRSQTARVQPTDQRRAIQLASDAVDQLHDWSGPTEAALHTLLQVLLLTGQFAKVLDRSRPAPDGRANHEESQRLDVRIFAATAATMLNQRDLASQLIDSLPLGVDQDLARLRLKDISGEVGDKRAAWMELLERLDKNRPEAMVQVIMRLSDLGVDESARLNPLVDDNYIMSDVRDLVAISAKAHVDLDAALPQFRLLAERDELAAAKLIEYLADAGKFDDAVVACEGAYLRYKNTDFIVRRADLLLQMDRDAEARTAATDALATSSIDPNHHYRAHRLLARLLLRQVASDPADEQIWRGIERHLTECVSSEELTAEASDVWQLTEAQMRLHKEGDAFATISRCEPLIASPGEARVWLTVMLAQPALTAQTYARMLELADVFADDVELSAGFLTAVINRTRGAEEEPATPADQRTTLEGTRRAAAFAALQDHVEQHGDQSPIKMLQAPTTEGLIAKITELVRRDEAPLMELAEMIRQARAPLGMFASAVSRPYSSTLASRPFGYYVAAAALEDDDLADEEAADASFNRDVVVDASALLVASELGEFDNFRSKFRRLLIPSASLKDIRAGRMFLEGQSSSSGSVIYDSTTDAIGRVELDINEHLGALARISKLVSALAVTQTVTDAPMDDLDIEVPQSEAWLGPVALAKSRDLSLWSDDLAQRRLARIFGVKTFGTTTLQQLRTAARLNDDALNETQYQEALMARRREVVDALRARIVDIPTDVKVVVEQAEAEGWDGRVALVTVGRPGWWHMAATPWSDLHSILSAVKEGGGPLDAWRYHAMWGVVRVAPDEASRAAVLLACVALVSIDALEEDRTIEHLTLANNIATQFDALAPSDFLVEAATVLELAGVFSYAPADVIRLRERFSKPPDEPDPTA